MTAGHIVDPTPEINTWFGTRELVCDPDYEIITAYFGTMLIASLVLLSLLVVPMADYHGRKAVNIVLGLILLVSLSLTAMS